MDPASVSTNKDLGSKGISPFNITTEGIVVTSVHGVSDNLLSKDFNVTDGNPFLHVSSFYDNTASKTAFDVTTNSPFTPVNHSLVNVNISEITDGCRLLTYFPWNNPSNVISSDTMLMIFRVLSGGLIPFISLIGVPLNVLNGIVFFKQGLRERINLLLFCLACSDFIVDLFLFVSTIEYFYTQLQGNFQINGPLVTFITNYGSIVYGSVYVSAFISTLISFERCMCITHPLIAKGFLKTKTMGIVVAIASVFLTALIYFVSAQKYRIGCGYHPGLNLKLAIHYPSHFYLQNKILMDVLNGLMYGMFLPAIFFLTTTLTTAITAVKLKTAAKWRQSASSVTMESKEIALTKMLVAVSCLFILCTIPNVILRIVPMVVEEFRLGGRHQNLLLSGIAVIYLANAINSAFNFVFYCKMGSRYRMILKGLCTKKRKDFQSENKSITMTTDMHDGRY